MTEHDHAGITAAAARTPIVANLDGRPITGRLVYWPNPKRRTGGAKARIQLASGAYLSVPTDAIRLPATTQGAG